MSHTLRRPKPISEPPLRAYAHRPPLESDLDRWAWRVVRHEGNRQHSVKGAGGRYTQREMKRKLLDLVEAGSWNEPTSVEDDRIIRTIGDLLTAWFTEQEARESRGNIASTTLSARNYQVNGLRGVLGTVRILELDSDHLQGWVDRSPLAPRTLRLRMSTLRGVWAWGIRQQLPLPAFPDVELPPVRRDEHRYNHVTPTPEQAAAMTEGLRPGWTRVAGEILMGTGCRIGEVGRLRWEDYRDGTLWVRQKGGPGKARYRGLAVNQRLAKVLGDWRTAQPTAPASTIRLLGVTPLTCKAELARQFQTLGAALGLDGVTPHSLRRMVSTRLISAGPSVVPVQVYEAQMGHSYAMGLEVYAQTTAADRAAVAALLEPPERRQGEVRPFRREGEK